MKELKKKCTRCSKIKGFSEFHFRNNAFDKLHPWCKECVKIYNDNYWRENREKELQRRLERNPSRTERIASYQRKYYQKNKEELSKKKKAYKQKNIDKIREYGRNYYFTVLKPKLQLRRQQNVEKDQSM